MRKLTLLVLVLLVGLSPAVFADSALLPAADGDLVVHELASRAAVKAASPGMPAPRDAVTFTFPLDPQKAEMPQAATPFVAHSREYFVEVDAAELRAGATLHVTAPNAIVRVHPVARETKGGDVRISAKLAPSSFVIENAAGGRFEEGTGMAVLADARAVKATGVPFAEGTVAFRLAPEVGAGAIRLAAPEVDAGRYQVHVFDRDSDAVLSLGADRIDYHHGDTLVVRAGFADAAGPFAADVVEGYVTSPAGHAWPVTFVLTDSGSGTYAARLPLDAREWGQGLWEAHVVARAERDGASVVRNASTAFGAHLPTAALAGAVRVERERGTLRLGFEVEVAAAGRYEVRGTLFGTDRATGELRPMAVGHAADWLEADGTLSLDFDASVLRGKGLGAPFELRDLRLLDQGRMGVLHRQARGLVIE